MLLASTAINEQLLVSNPKFRHLLSLLQTQLTPEGIPLELHQKLEDITQQLKTVKARYLSKLLLQNEIEDLTLELLTKKNEERHSSLLEKLLMKRFINLNTQAKRPSFSHHDLPFISNEQQQQQPLHCLLGLSPEEITSSQQIQDNSSKEELWTFLTAKLKEKVQQLKQCVIPSSSLASLPQGGNVSLLREYVQQQKHTLFNMQQQIRTITEEVRHIRQHYHQALHKCFSVLAQLLEKYKLTTQQRCDHILIKLLHARAQLMFKQLAVLEVQIANVLYTPESVSALRQIRRHLDRRIEEVQRTCQAGQERLESYRLLGQGFEVLVQTYAHLQNRIQEKRWVLEQLQHPNDSK